jgi:tetratricopeptide (TPR) repeat protein
MALQVRRTLIRRFSVVFIEECLMRRTIRFLLGGAFLILSLTACATTEMNIEERKKLSETNRRVGDAYTRQGDYTRALRYYLDAAKHYADDPQLQYSMGKAYLEKGSYNRAIVHLNRTLALKPDMMPAKKDLAIAYIKLEDNDQAILILKQMIEDQAYEIYATPQSPKYLLGWVYYQQGQYAESEHYLQEALDYYGIGINKDVTYVMALRVMGMNALAQLKPERALVYLEKAIPFAPKWPELYLDIARAHRLAGETPRAREAYNRVIELAEPGSELAATAVKEAASLN